MLPSDLLISRYQGATLIPKRLPLSDWAIALGQEAIEIYQDHLGKTQGELQSQLQEWEGDSTNYRVKRGLAHLLKNHFATVEVVSPLDPPMLRQLVFSAAAQGMTLPAQRQQILETVGDRLGAQLAREVLPEEVARGLYADLPPNRILTAFDPPDAEDLIHRYNLSQTQGIFYRAREIVIQAHRNDPGQYKILFKYLKLFQLMAYIEGDADTGFTITIDGPTSLFQASTRYGLAIAKLLPALLHVDRWSLQASLRHKDSYSGQVQEKFFQLDHRCGLVTHYKAQSDYDSMVEAAFAKRWEKTQTPWRLEREVDLIPLPGSVMIPDFRLVHPDGRDYLLEIMGYWRPEYLRKKFYQIRRGEPRNLILAISDRLNLEKAQVKFTDLPVQLVWFKDRLQPKAILEILDPKS